MFCRDDRYWHVSCQSVQKNVVKRDSWSILKYYSRTMEDFYDYLCSYVFPQTNMIEGKYRDDFNFKNLNKKTLTWESWIIDFTWRFRFCSLICIVNLYKSFKIQKNTDIHEVRIFDRIDDDRLFFDIREYYIWWYTSWSWDSIIFRVMCKSSLQRFVMSLSIV